MFYGVRAFDYWHRAGVLLSLTNHGAGHDKVGHRFKYWTCNSHIPDHVLEKGQRYGFQSLKINDQSAFSLSSYSVRFFGIVQHYGTVHECTRGYRSSHMVIRELAVINGSKDILDNLSNRYQVDAKNLIHENEKDFTKIMRNLLLYLPMQKGEYIKWILDSRKRYTEESLPKFLSSSQ